MAHGARETVVLLHSLGTDRNLWRYQTTHLGSRFRVLTPESRGHGRQAWHGTTDLEAWMRDIDEAVADEGSVHLVGLSMGGIQAMAFAATRPERVRSLVVANAFARLPGDVATARVAAAREDIDRCGMDGYARRYLGQTLTRQLDTADYRALRGAIAGMAPEAYLASAAATFGGDVIGHLAAITCPTLVVAGELDQKVPAERLAEIVTGITGARSAVVPDAGHLSCIENPLGFNALVAQFLDDVDGRVPEAGAAT